MNFLMSMCGLISLESLQQARKCEVKGSHFVHSNRLHALHFVSSCPPLYHSALLTARFGYSTPSPTSCWFRQILKCRGPNSTHSAECGPHPPTSFTCPLYTQVYFATDCSQPPCHKNATCFGGGLRKRSSLVLLSKEHFSYVVRDFVDVSFSVLTASSE